MIEDRIKTYDIRREQKKKQNQEMEDKILNEMKDRIFKALVLNDYENAPYAQWVKEGKKKIETRMNRLFSFRGDVVICCGKGKSVSPNAGKALCIVEIWKGRKMLNDAREMTAACIEWDSDRYSLLLRNWRYFSRDFEFAPMAIKRNFQGMFEIILPEDVEIIPKPEIEEYFENSNYKR